MVFLGLFDSKVRAQKKAEEDEKDRIELEQLRLSLGGRAIPLGGLYPEEIWWRDHFLWLKDVGYLLRSRYSPEWVPSWEGTDKYWAQCEDSWQMFVSFPCRTAFIYS